MGAIECRQRSWDISSLAKRDYVASGAAPMDIEPGMGRLAKGHKGKGKGKGKEKEKEKTGKGRFSSKGNAATVGSGDIRPRTVGRPRTPREEKETTKGKGKGKGGKGGKGKLGSLEDQTWPDEANSWGQQQWSEQTWNTSQATTNTQVSGDGQQFATMAGTVGSVFGLFRADEVAQSKNLRNLHSSTLGVISKQTRDISARTDLFEKKESQIKNLRTIGNSVKDAMRVKEKIDPRLKRDLEAGRSARMVKKRARKRKRAGLHRAKGRAERAKGRIVSDNLWHKNHDNPEHNPNPEDFVNTTQAIPGIEDDMKHDETLETTSHPKGEV